MIFKMKKGINMGAVVLSPVFWIMVIIGCLMLWFTASIIFNIVGDFVLMIYNKIKRTIEGSEEDEKDDEEK